MSTTKSTVKQISPELLDEEPETWAAIGTDSKNRTHKLGHPLLDRAVYVVGDDKVKRFDLSKTPYDVDDWVEHVREVCGWERCHVEETWGDVLARAREQ